MCGRFSQTRGLETVKKHFQVSTHTGDVLPRFNIAPSQDIAVIKQQDPRVLDSARWGLIPCWMKDPEKKSRFINARFESIREKP